MKFLVRKINAMFFLNNIAFIFTTVDFDVKEHVLICRVIKIRKYSNTFSIFTGSPIHCNGTGEKQQK